jgi:adenylyltransferase/sulfurtransferase
VRFDGQVAVFDMREANAACYACLFPEAGESEDMPCAIMGVFSPITGIVGSIQAAEALKLIAGIGEPLTGRLLLVDALTMQLRTIRLKKDPGCAVCGAGAR